MFPTLSIGTRPNFLDILVEPMGFEPTTSSMPSRRAPSCATAPPNFSSLAQDYPPGSTPSHFRRARHATPGRLYKSYSLSPNSIGKFFVHYEYCQHSLEIRFASILWIGDGTHDSPRYRFSRLSAAGGTAGANRPA